MERVRSWQAPDVPGLELFSAAFREHVFPRHSHDGLMLAVIDRGAQRVVHKGASHIAGPGCVVAIPPEEVHSGCAAAPQGWEYCVLTVPPRILSMVHGGGLQAGFSSSVVLDDPSLATRLRATYAAFARSATTLEREERLLGALTIYFTQHARPVSPSPSVGREQQAIERAMEFLATRRDGTVTLEELSAAAGLDGFRLTRAFTRWVGMPPHAYHLQSRLRAAQERLARGDCVVEVAHRGGFADQAHFSRHFKRLTGVTPGQYRAAHGHRAVRR